MKAYDRAPVNERGHAAASIMFETASLRCIKLHCLPVSSGRVLSWIAGGRDGNATSHALFLQRKTPSGLVASFARSDPECD
jgi:hypothetical protein